MAKVIPLIVKLYLQRRICQHCKKVGSSNIIFCNRCYCTNLRKRREIKSTK